MEVVGHPLHQVREEVPYGVAGVIGVASCGSFHFLVLQFLRKQGEVRVVSKGCLSLKLFCIGGNMSCELWHGLLLEVEDCIHFIRIIILNED